MSHFTSKESASWVFDRAITPAGVLGVTGPKPIPYRLMVSPGLAGRVVAPVNDPAGRANDLAEHNRRSADAPREVED